MTAVHQDSLLINTYTNDLAIVPDLFAPFACNRKRGKVFDESDFLDILYEQSPIGQQPAKRHCTLPTYMQLGSNYQLTSLDLGTDSMQKEKTIPSFSFVSTPANELKQNQEKVALSIVEEPEQFYRARYDSEGVRAPLKGINENYPTVEIRGQNIKQAVITVKLVHEDGSTHSCCSLDSSDDRKKALIKRVVPSPTSNSVKAEFEDLRIRREKKKEGRKSASSVEKNRDGKYDKMAFLLFTAEVDTNYGHVKCSARSSPISLTAAPEPAELDWLVPTRGHFGGKEVVAIKGSKMTSPKVLFRIRGMNGELIELPGAVDKEKSHQNVLLVRTPIVDHHSFGLNHQRIEASVVVITGRTQMCSNSLDFEFIPNDICRECMQETPMKTVPSSAASCHSTGSTLGIGMSPCSPMPSSSPGILPSPRPVYSPSYVQSGLSSPPSKSPFHDQLDMGPLPSVQNVHGPLTIVPPVSRESPIQTSISLTSYESFDAYGSSPHSGMNPKDKDIMQIVEHLLSPVGSTASESSPLPQYSCPEVLPLYTNSPCHPPSPEVPSSDTFGRIEEALVALQSKNMITGLEFMFFMSECKRYNVDLLKVYSEANGDLLTFQQQLASIKPPISFPSTRQ